MNMSWQKHTNTKFQSCSIILQKIPNWQSNPQKKAYAKCDKKETNKNKLKVKKEKQIKLWLGSGSMLRWKGFFVVFFLILTRLMSEINRASANSTTTRQPITKILTVTTQHSEWRNKQRKRNSILGGRKQSKGGRGLFLFLSCAVLVCLTRSSRKEIKSEITQLSNNIFCSYLVSDREISQGRKGKEEHREGCVVCIQNRFTTIIFWYFAFGTFIYKSKGFFQWGNLRFTCCCIFLAWTTVCAQDTKLFSPTRYTSKKTPKNKKTPMIRVNLL